MTGLVGLVAWDGIEPPTRGFSVLVSSGLEVNGPASSAHLRRHFSPLRERSYTDVQGQRGASLGQFRPLSGRRAGHGNS